MEIKKQGNSKNFVGKAKCKLCGCVFTYEDSDVFSKKTGYSHSGITHSGVHVGDSNIKYDYYVSCPNCQSYVKTESIKEKRDNCLLLALFTTICVILILVMVSFLIPTGIVCPKCGHRTDKISEYNQYRCPYYNCDKKEGTHIEYHCGNCWEYYHIVE